VISVPKNGVKPFTA